MFQHGDVINEHPRLRRGKVGLVQQANSVSQHKAPVCRCSRPLPTERSRTTRSLMHCYQSHVDPDHISTPDIDSHGHSRMSCDTGRPLARADSCSNQAQRKAKTHERATGACTEQVRILSRSRAKCTTEELTHWLARFQGLSGETSHLILQNAWVWWAPLGISVL